MAVPSSPADRAATAILEGVAVRLWGFSPRLMPVIVSNLGAGGALLWFFGNMPRYERTLKVFGPVRTHLICTMISALNGCPYCTFGHAYALELAYLRQCGHLFPLDERDFAGLHARGEDEAYEVVTEALKRVDLAADAVALKTLRDVAAGGGTGGDEERRIKHLIEMLGVLNVCGIRGNVAPDEAHDPVNKDAVLKHRYAALRAEERTRRPHQEL